MTIPQRHYWGGCATHQSHFTWASFGRKGGISSAPYQSGNISSDVGDSEYAVSWNRERVLEEIGGQTMLSAQQIHSDKIFIQNRPLSDTLQVEGYDALITNQHGIALMIQQADCQAVLLADSSRQIIAAIHVGWRGNILNIIQKTVTAMAREFACKPENIEAYISPSLGPCCAEFINYRIEFPIEFQQHLCAPNHFDLWELSRSQLQQSGVSTIKAAKICTCCSDDFFSYRRSQKAGETQTGRNCSLITMEQF